MQEISLRLKSGEHFVLRIIKVWQDDYKAMQESMIYGEHITFEQLIERIRELQTRFRSI